MPFAENPSNKKNEFRLDPKTKLLRHKKNVEGILDGKFEPPIMVDVDVVEGFCNLDCAWCSQAKSRALKPRHYMKKGTMYGLGKFSKKWGIKSWRIATDSEPTLNKDLHHLFISGKENNIDMGLTTNGVLLDTIKNLDNLTWIGISLDAVNAKTWSLAKRSPEKNFHRIIDNIKMIKDKFPDLDLSIKYHKWSSVGENLGKNDFYPDMDSFSEDKKFKTKHKDEVIENIEESKKLPELAKKLGVPYVLRDAFPADFAKNYKFTKCLATPLSGTFGADHKFHLCCDARNVFVLTDDYTRDNWEELPRLWSSKKHKKLIDSINPQKCLGCSKFKLCSVLENVVTDGEYTKDYQVNFI